MRQQKWHLVLGKGSIDFGLAGSSAVEASVAEAESVVSTVEAFLLVVEWEKITNGLSVHVEIFCIFSPPWASKVVRTVIVIIQL